MSDEQPTPEDVKAFIAAAPPATDTVAIPVDPAVLAEVAGEPGAEQPEAPRVEVPMDQTFTQSQTVDAGYLWTLQMPNIGQVEVSDHEKTIYMKQFMHDEPIVLPIEIRGVKTRIRTRTEWDIKVIWEALAYLTEQKKIADPAMGTTIMQQMCAAVQVIEVQGLEFPHINLDPKMPLSQSVQQLITHVADHYEPLRTPKWNAILTCLRIFVAKISLCDTNIANESFWNPAS